MGIELTPEGGADTTPRVKLHLIGVCGTGMGSLAGLLKEAGHEVRGSDEHVYPPMSTQLAAQEIPVCDGFRPENLDWAPDAVVVGNVCRRDHVEVLAAQARGLQLTSFPAVLEEHFLAKSHSLVVAGTHGKTTTSALAASVLSEAGRNPGYLIGGVPFGLPQSFHAGAEGGPFVVEGDEYDTAFFDKGSKFFHYRPRTAILTSVELDHIDIFDSLEAVKESFRKFVALIPEEGLLVVSADDPGALECAAGARCRVERYSLGDAPSEWRARATGTRPGGRTLFKVERRGESFGDFETGMAGAYNLGNALAVIAAVADLGVPAVDIARGVRRFAGVRRRQEVRGVAQGVTVVDDFAHHPTAVRNTLGGLRGRFGGGRIFAVFEPRSATSRRALFQKDYAEAFGAVDEVIIGAVNAPEKAPEGDRFDPEQLAADLRSRGVAARFVASVEQIAEQIAARAAPGDTVVVMSSGGFGGVHDRILERLGLAVTAAQGDDGPKVKAVLERVSLPYPDMEAHLGELLVLRDGGDVIGCVAMELYEETGLLRALAVIPERRGEGLGWMLADAALERARQRGCRGVFLTTEHATDFFAEKFGFKTCDRTALSRSMLTSSQFRTARGALMKIDL
ncbi:MAG: UDP-N-acetylmuramate:L-alanyl-gamma-D-glutamyl-meso-diaminopimelate ligase [Myxococcales bacterium]|nr:UDP-N-acetylmuramate:L-alanyl-gamma-D-glutamyl-meso-diaminopimelate ligase [Myxococcales bacterium]